MVVLGHATTITTSTRILQQAAAEWLEWLLTVVLLIVGLAASVVLVYFVSLLCDKFFVSSTATAVSRRSENNEESRRQQAGFLDRSRLDIEDRKQIVKQLFANETFLYSVETAASSTTSVETKNNNLEAQGEDDAAEAGIQLQNMRTLDTIKSDDTPKKVSAEVTTTDARANRGDLEEGIKEDTNDLEESIKKLEAKDKNKLGAGEEEEEGGSEPFSANNECCICLAPYVAGDTVLRSKHCPHMFHAACCEDWILQKPVCPLCTTPMILEAEWEATAVSVLGRERYDAMLAE
jgi:Ring finger domain